MGKVINFRNIIIPNKYKHIRNWEKDSTYRYSIYYSLWYCPQLEVEHTTHSNTRTIRENTGSNSIRVTYRRNVKEVRTVLKDTINRLNLNRFD